MKKLRHDFQMSILKSIGNNRMKSRILGRKMDENRLFSNYSNMIFLAGKILREELEEGA